MILQVPLTRSRELRTNPGETFCLRCFTLAHRETLEQSVSCLAPPPGSPSGIGASLATLASLVSGDGIISYHDEPQDPTQSTCGARNIKPNTLSFLGSPDLINYNCNGAQSGVSAKLRGNLRYKIKIFIQCFKRTVYLAPGLLPKMRCN